MSLNIRGFGYVGKGTWVKNLVRKYEVEFVAIQESKISDCDKFDFAKIWPNGDWDTDMVAASGNSGGLVNGWNTRKFKKLKSVEERNLLITTGALIEDGTVINFVNVYAPQKVRDKRLLWERLKGIMLGDNGLWFLLGDFNSVRWKEERKNSKFNVGLANDFNLFIDEVNLHEYKMNGSRFTLFQVL